MLEDVALWIVFKLDINQREQLVDHSEQGLGMLVLECKSCGRGEPMHIELKLHHGTKLAWLNLQVANINPCTS